MTVQAVIPVADLVRHARDPRRSIREQHAAFAELVGRFEAMALAIALDGCENAESARDACQEAFFLAWRRLPSLQEPAAFGGWLKRLVRTQCARARRRGFRRPPLGEPAETAIDTSELVGRREVQVLVRHAIAHLPAAEREAVLLYYFLGESLRDVARRLGVTAGRAGRLVYDARLRLRKTLPRSVTESFWKHARTPSLARRIRNGLFDELAGEYEFAERPGHRVVVRREGEVLAGYAGGQRHTLTSWKPDTLVAAEFDGEARFRRNRRGRISHFVYYEFGRRLGVARKLSGGAFR